MCKSERDSFFSGTQTQPFSFNMTCVCVCVLMFTCVMSFLTFQSSRLIGSPRGYRSSESSWKLSTPLSSTSSVSSCDRSWTQSSSGDRVRLVNTLLSSSFFILQVFRHQMKSLSSIILCDASPDRLILILSHCTAGFVKPPDVWLCVCVFVYFRLTLNGE